MVNTNKGITKMNKELKQYFDEEYSLENETLESNGDDPITKQQFQKLHFDYLLDCELYYSESMSEMDIKALEYLRNGGKLI